MITIDPAKKAKIDAEKKAQILEVAMDKRDILLQHLAWLYLKAKEESDAPKALAVSAAITSLQGIFADPRVAQAIDGAALPAIKVVYLEIFSALAVASPASYLALKALDPL